VIIGRHGRFEAREAVMITWREREEVIGVFINSDTWRRSFEDGHTTVLNRGGRWCSDGDMVLGVTA
jgi:hypothetical protein